MRDTQGSTKEAACARVVLVSAPFRYVSPRIWASTSVGRVMGCRAHDTADTRQPTRIKRTRSEVDDAWSASHLSGITLD